MNQSPFILGFVGFSGAGKTTILTKVIQQLKAKGYAIAAIKHSHHHFDIDRPGKDSFRLREAGADQVIIGSKHRFALMVELNQGKEPNLKILLNQLNINELDFIFIEGFKHESFPKIEVHRPELGHPLLAPTDTDIIAIATNQTSFATNKTILSLDDPTEIVAFILSKALLI